MLLVLSVLLLLLLPRLLLAPPLFVRRRCKHTQESATAVASVSRKLWSAEPRPPNIRDRDRHCSDVMVVLLVLLLSLLQVLPLAATSFALRDSASTLVGRAPNHGIHVEAAARGAAWDHLASAPAPVCF